jgi:aminomethyltransferase
MAAGAETLKRTPLHDRHVAAGARIVPFAGWEMPVQYDGIRAEHRAVRSTAGVFDVSHMGEIETSGPDAAAFLQRILSNDVSRLADGGAQYSVLCREDGGVLDDLFTYRLGDRFLTVTNASNHARDLAWFQRHAQGFRVTLADRVDDLAMLAVQGPDARALVARIAEGELPGRFETATLTVAGVPGVLVCGTGYTLRLEVCFHLYGNDLMEERGPIEAGLGWCCKEDTGFIGSGAVRAVREAGPREKLAAFALTGKGIARQGNPVAGGGEVTSGTLSPCLGIGIGMAYLPAERAKPGTAIEIDVRGTIRPAQVRKKPLYAKEES